MKRWLILLAFVVALGGCGSEADSTPSTEAASANEVAEEGEVAAEESAETEAADPAPTATTGSGAIAPEATATSGDDAANPSAQDLVGRWAHFDAVAYQDGTLKTLIVSYGFNDFDLVDGDLVDSASFCFSEQRTDQPIQTSLSDAATQAIQPPPTVVDVDVVDGRLRLRRPASPTPVGIRLDDPFNESLPEDPNDPRIVDDDGDGNPGITVTIEVSPELIGELYIARREIFSYEAELLEPDRLIGSVTDDSEQLVIGASNPIFETSGGDWTQLDDPDRNPVILQRVDDGWDCERLAAERDSLFPPTPQVDW